ncbi:hypothetical protein C8R46DRAFT_1242543 [Mycena filopes]|nr:hypothetical protein C8R46DRAFT_1242543 [Mycena filopes]
MASLHSNLTYSPERSYSPEDFYPNPHLADDPSTNNSAYMDIYSTPGPGYRTVPPVYFDSPTEDPSASDPMEPVYEVDSLDFRWEPFIHKAGSGKVHVPAPLVGRDSAIVSDYYYETRVEPDGEDDKAGQLYASINMGPTAERDASPGPFSFAPPADDLPPTPNEHRENSEDGTAATPERPQFFAPVPGIFISPLRGDEMPKTPLKKSEAAQDGGHALSQTSNDSIEDWDDATD